LGRRCADVDEWVTKLNQFAAEQVGRWGDGAKG
jgi:hypothetical protein